MLVFLVLDPFGVDFEIPSGPPTLKNLNFTNGKPTFSKRNELSDLNMPLRVIWGPLGLAFGALGRLLAALLVSKLFIWGLMTFHLGAREALNGPKQLPRRLHGEADGPMKPPRLIWRRTWTNFPEMLNTKSMRGKKKQET